MLPLDFETLGLKSKIRRIFFVFVLKSLLRHFLGRVNRTEKEDSCNKPDF